MTSNLKRAARAAILIPACYYIGTQQLCSQERTAQSPGGSVSGAVFEQSTGVPVQGATVSLMSSVNQPGEKRAIRSVDSLPDGSYLIGQVHPGKYLLFVEREGYVETSRQLTLDSQRADATVRFSLARTASLSGRVVYENGTGIPGLRVGAWVAAYKYGRLSMQGRGFAVSGQDGSYQISRLRRGSYFVGVLPPLIKPSSGVPPQDAAPNSAVYARSFFSDAPSLSEAAALQLGDEQRLTGVDLRVRKTVGYCVSAALPSSVKNGSRLIVSLDRSASPSEPHVGTGVLSYSGAFSFCDVPSGDYLLSASVVGDEPTTGQLGEELITVDRKHLAVPVLALEASKQLTGRIVADPAQSTAQSLPSIELRLEPVDRWPIEGEDTAPKIAADGLVTFPSVYSSKYWVNIDRISTGYYVSQISAGRRDALCEPIQVGDGELTTWVRSDGPSLTGIVTAESRDEMPPNVIAVLVSKSGGCGQSIRSSRVDQAGRFSFDNIPPGKFSVLALSGLGLEDAENPSVIGRLLVRAKEVELAPHSNQTVELHPIPVT